MVNKTRILVSVAVFALVLGVQWGVAHEGHDDAPGEAQGGSGPLILTAEAKKNLDIQTAEAKVMSIEKTVSALGTVQPVPSSRENGSSRISGRVAKLLVAPGQSVKKGEVLLVLEARQLADTAARVSVRAPRSGKIVRLEVIQGDPVEPGTPLFEIASYTEVYAVARVYESQIGRIRVGMSARVYSPFVKNRAMDSKVDFIGSEVNPQGRTVEVRLRVKNPAEELKINMAVNVSFIVDKGDETIAVPRSAVLGSGGEKFVFVEDGNTYTRTLVVTGAENDRWVEIVEGVNPGDVVVTRGNYQLQFAKPKPVQEHGAKMPLKKK